MSIDTNPPGWRPPRTPEQAADAAEDLLRDTARRSRRWPRRRYDSDPAEPADNTAGGDERAWRAGLGDTCDHDWAVLRDPERYGRTFR